MSEHKDSDGSSGLVLTRWAVRVAHPVEVGRIQQIGREADRRFLQTAYPQMADDTSIPEGVAQRAIEAGRLWVAHQRDVIAGWVYVGLLDDEWCLGQISVAQASERRGAGSALIRHMQAEAQHHGANSIVLNTQADIPWHQPWFERFGFEVVPREAWSPALHGLTAQQEASGLSWQARVHMRWRAPDPM